MTKLKLTKEDAQEQLLIGQATFYNWINSNKYESEEDEATKTKYLIIDEEVASRIRAKKEAKQAKNKNNELEQFNIDNSIKLHNEVKNNINDLEYSKIENENKSENIINAQSLQFDEVIKTITDLALKAGKFELLEDKQKTVEKDKEHWQSQYFEIKYKYENVLENSKLIQNNYDNILEKYKKIEQENEKLKKELDLERNKPFWKKKVL